MENQEKNTGEERLRQLQEVISSAPQRIEQEFQKGLNPWASCLGSVLFRIEAYLASPLVEAVVPAEKYQEALRRLEELKEKTLDLKERYPEKEGVPPEEVKEEFLKALDVFQ